MRPFIWEYAYATRDDDRKTLKQDVDYRLQCKTNMSLINPPIACALYRPIYSLALQP